MTEAQEKAIAEALSLYLTATGMESIDPAKMGAAMFIAGWEAGQAASCQELSSRIRAMASLRFTEHGPYDARGAAIWDVANWLVEKDD